MQFIASMFCSFLLSQESVIRRISSPSWTSSLHRGSTVLPPSSSSSDWVVGLVISFSLFSLPSTTTPSPRHPTFLPPLLSCLEAEPVCGYVDRYARSRKEVEGRGSHSDVGRLSRHIITRVMTKKKKISRAAATTKKFYNRNRTVSWMTHTKNHYDHILH